MPNFDVEDNHDIMIREATENDEEAVYRLAAQLATSYTVQRAAFGTSFANVLQDDAAVVFIAQCAHTSIGYCLGFSHSAFYANGNVAWLEEIFVEEAFRTQHIGRRLMNAFEEWAKLRNCSLSALATRRAAEFYQAIGYEESAIYFKKPFNRGDGQSS